MMRSKYEPDYTAFYRPYRWVQWVIIGLIVLLAAVCGYSQGGKTYIGQGAPYITSVTGNADTLFFHSSQGTDTVIVSNLLAGFLPHTLIAIGSLADTITSDTSFSFTRESGEGVFRVPDRIVINENENRTAEIFFDASTAGGPQTPGALYGTYLEKGFNGGRFRLYNYGDDIQIGNFAATGEVNTHFNSIQLFSTDGSSPHYGRLRVTTDGGVGVGESDPQGALHVTTIADTIYDLILEDQFKHPALAFATVNNIRSEIKLLYDAAGDEKLVFSFGNVYQDTIPAGGEVFTLVENGDIILNDYTAGHAGTPAFNIQIDNTGKLILTDTAGSGGPWTEVGNGIQYVTGQGVVASLDTFGSMAVGNAGAGNVDLLVDGFPEIELGISDAGGDNSIGFIESGSVKGEIMWEDGESGISMFVDALHAGGYTTLNTTVQPQLHINSVGVGIWTDDPTDELHVLGQLGSDVRVLIEGQDGRDAVLRFGEADEPNNWWEMGVDQSGDDKFRLYQKRGISTTVVMYIDTFGHVGIFDSNPEENLHVSANLGDIAILVGNDNWYGAETNAGVNGKIIGVTDITDELRIGDIDNSFSEVQIYEGGAELITLLGGEVGIGNATPAEKLHVNGNVQIENDGGASTLIIEDEPTGQQWTLSQTFGGGDLTLSQSLSADFVINEDLIINGRVSIDTSGTVNEEFAVKGIGAVYSNPGQAVIWKWINEADGYQWRIQTAGSGNNDFIIRDHTSGLDRMRFYDNSNAVVWDGLESASTTDRVDHVLGTGMEGYRIIAGPAYNASSYAAIQFWSGSSAFGGDIYFDYPGDVYFRQNGSINDLFIKDGTGYIGIGTNNPAHKLHSYVASGANHHIIQSGASNFLSLFESSASDPAIYWTSGNVLRFGEGSNNLTMTDEIFRLAQDGNGRGVMYLYDDFGSSVVHRADTTQYRIQFESGGTGGMIIDINPDPNNATRSANVRLFRETLADEPQFQIFVGDNSTSATWLGSRKADAVAYMYAGNANGKEAVVTPYKIHLFKDVTQNVGGTQGDTTFISWDDDDADARVDPGYTFEDVTNPSRIQVDVAGRYQVKATLVVDNTGTNRITLKSMCKINGNTEYRRGAQYGYSRGTATDGYTSVHYDTEIELGAGDYIEFCAILHYTQQATAVNTVNAECEIIINRIE